MKKTQLTLVGAGPGDPELITIKGIKALADADVVLYDDLVSPDLLQYAPNKSEKIYVGKRVGKHSHTQQSINELIVFFAYEKGHVVRLKGGDPFIFGRGFEEIKYATKHHIPTRIVSGVSSAYAVPALYNIPLTSRGVSTSFQVITATNKAGLLTKDMHAAVRFKGTVVVLMGTRKLKEIAELYRTNGRSEEKIAIIQNGSMPNEKHISGKMENIVCQAKAAQIGSPAVMVIGEVVGLSQNLHKQILARYGE